MRVCAVLDHLHESLLHPVDSVVSSQQQIDPAMKSQQQTVVISSCLKALAYLFGEFSFSSCLTHSHADLTVALCR